MCKFHGGNAIGVNVVWTSPWDTQTQVTSLSLAQPNPGYLYFSLAQLNRLESGSKQELRKMTLHGPSSPVASLATVNLLVSARKEKKYDSSVLFLITKIEAVFPVEDDPPPLPQRP